MLANIKHAFDLFLSVYGLWILLALGITLSLKYLTGRQKEIAFVESCLSKVDGFLHQAKTQNTRIKINILLWVSRDGRDVVNS